MKVTVSGFFSSRNWSIYENKNAREECMTFGAAAIAPVTNVKALFNNVFTFKILSCMSLHAICVFDVKMKP